MELLPLKIVLGLQVAAAVVIFIQLMFREEDGKLLRVRKSRAGRGAIKGRR